MQVTTSRFGVIHFEKKGIVTFPTGIPGFEENRRYVLVHSEKLEPFQWLQSVEDPNLAFLVVDIHVLCPDYDLQLGGDDRSDLRFSDEDELGALAIAGLTGPGHGDLSVNMQGPLIINASSRRGKQVIHSSYPAQLKVT